MKPSFQSFRFLVLAGRANFSPSSAEEVSGHQLCPRLLFGFSLCEASSLLPFSPFSKTTGDKSPYRNRVKQRLLCGRVGIQRLYIATASFRYHFGLVLGNEYTL